MLVWARKFKTRKGESQNLCIIRYAASKDEAFAQISLEDRHDVS